MISLCAPTSEISCFGCCPPIRPAHYDPLLYAGSLRREFVENRLSFLSERPSYRPIVGHSCWALGFLDSRGRKVGCLLHPAQNGGRDLRGLINYGNKCRRESCAAARVFAALPMKGRLFWLPLVDGLNSFYFSSPRANPLFHLLGWGALLLEMLRRAALEKEWTVTELLRHAGFLASSRWSPKAHGFLFRLALEKKGSLPEDFDPIERCCERVLQETFAGLEDLPAGRCAAQTMHTHKLPMDPDFLNFLRLGLGLKRASEEEADRLRRQVDRLTDRVLCSSKRA